MKTKRFFSMLLVVMMVVQLLPFTAAAAVVPSSEAYAKVTELPPGEGKIITAIDSFTVSNGTVSMTLSVPESYTGKSSSGMEVRAVIVSAANYVDATKFNNQPTNVTVTNWNQTNASLDGTFWRYGNAKINAQKATISNFNNTLRKPPIATDNISGNQVTDNDCYYDDYVCILHVSEVGTGKLPNYVVFKFQVDSQGNLKSDSYMVRYVKNTDSIGTKAEVKFQNDKNKSIPQTITKPSTVDTPLTTDKYTRDGYTFMGWDEDAEFLAKKVPGKPSKLDTKGTDWVNSVASLSDETAKAGMDYPVGGANTTIPAQAKDSIYNLYAQWKPIQITLTPVTEKPGGTALETTPHNAAYDKYQAKVNVQFAWEFNVVGASGTTKGVMVTEVKEVAPGTTTAISGSITTKEQLLNTYGLSIAAAPSASVTSAGGIDLTRGTGGKVYLTGTPKRPTENDILVTIRTWDKTNFSYAEQVLRIKGIAKGAQMAPALDVNTGLQSNVLTTQATGETAAAKDGVIFGLYSMAQAAENGYSSISSGTGSIYENYTKIQTTAAVTRNESLLYEYIPYKDAEDNDYFKEGDPETAKFDPKNAANWREVPLPKTFYSTDAQKKLAPSMTALATEKAHSSNKSNAAQSAIVTVETPADWAGWSPEYGYITFDKVDALGAITAGGGFPVIHGLVEGATYLVRMKANNDYSESNAVSVTIKEGGGGGGSGDTPTVSGGLAVNLAGGSYTEETKEEYDKLVAAAAQLTPGADTILDLKDFPFEPVREGYEFLGWTLGEWANGGPILYRHKDTSSETPEPPTEEPEPPPEPETPEARDGESEGGDSENGGTEGSEPTPPAPTEEIQYIWIDGHDNSQIGDPVTAATAPEDSTYPTPPTHEGYKFTGWTVGEVEEIENVKTVKITANYEAEEPVEIELPEQVPFLIAPASIAAVWYANSEPDMSKVKTITFYDWDGTTKLGVVAVQSGFGMAASDYQTFLAGLYDTSVMEIDKADPYKLAVTDKEGYIYNPERTTKPMLTDKGGYTFSGWVPLDDEFSHYATADEEQMNAALIDWSTLKVSDHMDVKACYLANSKCGTANGVFYTLEYNEIERSGTNYTLRIDVSRYFATSQDKFPMRMQEPILRVQLYPVGSSAAITLSVQLENKDCTSATFTFPSSIGRVQAVSADINGVNGVAGSAIARSAPIDLSSTDNAARQNYIKFGTVYLMNESARKTKNTVTASITGFTTASYFNTDLAITASGSGTAKSKKLLEAWRAANEWTKTSGPAGDGILDENSYVHLTYAQTEAVLNDRPNVYLKNVSFVDEDPRAEYIKGTFKWDRVNVTDVTVETAESINGFKVYWSRDGITLGTPVEVTVKDGEYSFTDSVKKQYYDRYLLVCATDGSGAELPVSAVIPVIDLAND